MINSLEIKNIQSHKDSKLEFSPGINALVGTSNNGKSAILRALNWAIYNRPLGTEILLSNWAYDKNGKQNDEMYVKIKKGNSVLIRRKTKSENEYILNDERMEAIKTDVPESVKNFFSLSETNIQRQLDSPFLLSLSSGKIAEYFNKIVRLDIIDKVLTNAETTRRNTKNRLLGYKEEQSRLEDELKKYEWIPSVEKLIEKYKAVNSKYQNNFLEWENLSVSVEKFEEINKRDYPDFSEQKEIISNIEKIDLKNEKLQEEIESLSASIFNFESLSNKFNFDFDREKKAIECIENMDFNSSEIERLEEEIEKMEYAENCIKGSSENIKALKKRLPDICPICGSKMKDGKCVEE